MADEFESKLTKLEAKLKEDILKQCQAFVYAQMDKHGCTATDEEDEEDDDNDEGDWLQIPIKKGRKGKKKFFYYQKVVY